MAAEKAAEADAAWVRSPLPYASLVHPFRIICMFSCASLVHPVHTSTSSSLCIPRFACPFLPCSVPTLCPPPCRATARPCPPPACPPHLLGPPTADRIALLPALPPPSLTPPPPPPRHGPTRPRPPPALPPAGSAAAAGCAAGRARPWTPPRRPRCRGGRTRVHDPCVHP